MCGQCASAVCTPHPHPGRDRATRVGPYPEALTTQWVWEGLGLSTTDTLGQIILCRGGRPVCFSPLGSRRPAPYSVTTEGVRRHVSPGRQNRGRWEARVKGGTSILRSRGRDLASWALGIISVAAGSGREGATFRGLQIFAAFHPHMNRVWESGVGGGGGPAAQRLQKGPRGRSFCHPHPHAGTCTRPPHTSRDVDKGLGPESEAGARGRAWWPPRGACCKLRALHETRLLCDPRPAAERDPKATYSFYPKDPDH